MAHENEAGKSPLCYADKMIILQFQGLMMHASFILGTCIIIYPAYVTIQIK